MKKICHNSASTIYEDGDNWVISSQEDKRVISKKSQPYLPLAAVIKYEMIEDDKEVIDDLSKKNMREYNIKGTHEQP